MKGLARCETFFRSYGEPMLGEQFPEERAEIAAGLFGPGSECWGFDDELSKDHDFEPRFYLFVDESADRRFGLRLQRAYEEHLRRYGTPAAAHSRHADRRGGVVQIGAFFSDLIGGNRPPESDMEWLAIPDYALSAATNGKVFCDGPGRVTAFREALRRRPADVTRKKIAARLAMMAQSGQYNFLRCCRRGEYGAAHLAADEFVRHAAALAFSLDGAYAPHEKWLFRALRELPGREPLAGALETVLAADDRASDRKSALIEEVCAGFADELRKRGLSDSQEVFLEAHAESVTEHIRSAGLRCLHLMEG